jgi:pyrroloquinoline quinone biosynthesis protein E
MNVVGSMTGDNGARPAGPRWLLAELTYRCPLHCVFCYNPVDYMAHGAELSTDDWVRVLREGRALGAIQLGFSGGEPLLRDDLEILVAEARGLGYYSHPRLQGSGARPYPALLSGFDARGE